MPITVDVELTTAYTFDSVDSLDARFDEAKIATAQLRDMTEFNETDWAKGWVTTREVSDRRGGSITIPAPPWHFSGHDGTLTTQVPARQGEHNKEILKEIGLTTDQIDTLTKAGALIALARETVPEI